MGRELGDLVVGLTMFVCSLIGVFVAARGQGNEIYMFVLSLAGWSAVFIFALSRRRSEARVALRAVPAPRRD